MIKVCVLWDVVERERSANDGDCQISLKKMTIFTPLLKWSISRKPRRVTEL